MDKLLALIEEVRARVDEFRRQELNEATTRRILVERFLEALGWDVYDPAEVQYEFTTIDGKPVDYALKLNRRPVLLVEAKPLGDALQDVRAEAQIVRYAAAQGVTWCILTNGVRWKVYRSTEEGPAPEKLMFEVSVDPKDAADTSASALAQRMRRFSREEMARGTLDALGEQTFTDGKVRKALATLMRQPPRKLLNLVRQAIGDAALTPQRIRESLMRLARGSAPAAAGAPALTLASTEPRAGLAVGSSARGVRGGRRSPGPRASYDESHHTAGKPREVIELYRAVQPESFALRAGEVRQRYLAERLNFECDGRTFCSVHLRQGGLRVWLHLRFQDLPDPPPFARDVSPARGIRFGDRPGARCGALGFASCPGNADAAGAAALPQAAARGA